MGLVRMSCWVLVSCVSICSVLPVASECDEGEVLV